MPRIVVVCLVLAFGAIASIGCVPRTVVKKNPPSWDKGVRYYRPKPYLKLAPHLVKAEGKDALVPDPSSIEISLEYLPDFSEEYSIHVKSGFGTNNTSMTLDQGWNLTALNVDIDSKTAENISAVGDLVGSVAGAFKGDMPPGPAGSHFVVQATNVPMGYYEAVIGMHCGKKQLHGFRYVGFLPFASCPQMACGRAEPFDCSAPGEIYGLVFKNGIMTFQSLGDIQSLEAKDGLNSYKKVQDITAESVSRGSDVAPIADEPATTFHGSLPVPPRAE